MGEKTSEGNLLADLRFDSEGEVVEQLLARRNVRINRICTAGQASPAGFYYDQAEDEFVVMVQGSAELEVEGATRHLCPQDWIFIPAHAKHRVDAASAEAVWLTVHIS